MSQFAVHWAWRCTGLARPAKALLLDLAEVAGDDGRLPAKGFPDQLLFTPGGEVRPGLAELVLAGLVAADAGTMLLNMPSADVQVVA